MKKSSLIRYCTQPSCLPNVIAQFVALCDTAGLMLLMPAINELSRGIQVHLLGRSQLRPTIHVTGPTDQVIQDQHLKLLLTKSDRPYLLTKKET